MYACPVKVPAPNGLPTPSTTDPLPVRFSPIDPVSDPLTPPMPTVTVQTALGGYQSIRELVVPGGRLYESRKVIVESTAANPAFTLRQPQGAMYAFVGVDTSLLPDFDDQQFALDLLEQKHVLVAPGVSFNVPYRNHFRITNLPDAATLRVVFQRIDELLAESAR